MVEQRPRGGQAAAEPRLGRGDWIDAALETLLTMGVEALRITRLADELSVTRGSFYWHFKDRGDLLDALVDRWRAKNTAAVIEAVETASSLADGILGLFDAWIDPDRFDPRLDAALRDWARRAPDIRQAVEAADRIRLDAVTGLFRRFGYPMPEAFIRARVIYFAQIGYYTLVHDEPMDERFDYLEAYFKSFTGVPLDPDRAAAHRAHHLGQSEDPA